MDIKMWLKRGSKLNEEIDALLNAKDRAYELACSTTTVTDKLPIKVNGNHTEDKLIRYVDFSKMVDDKIDKLIEIKKEILTAINQVEDSTYRTLLIERYINFKTWEEIADIMCYSFQHIHKLHNKALKKMR